MSTVYMNPQHSSSTLPFLELKGDQQHSPPILGYLQHDHVITSTNHTYFSRSNFENHNTSTEFLAMDYSKGAHQEKVVENPPNLGQVRFGEDGSGCSHMYPFDNQGDHKIEIIKTDQKYKQIKPTKLRIMQTSTMTGKSNNMIGERNLHHDHYLARPPSKVYCKISNETNNNGLRMCSDCHTSTTPLWRSGPKGPKSLCNACGIRQRKKARRAAIAAAAVEFAKDGNVISPVSSSTSTTTTNNEAPNLRVDERKLNHDDHSLTLPLKKRSKTLDASWGNDDNNSIDEKCHKEKTLCLEDFAMNSSKNYNSSQRDFPRDEVEGAILLMRLSCGDQSVHPL